METEQKSAKAKSKYHLFGGFYCAELEVVCNGVKRNEILLEMYGILFYNYKPLLQGIVAEF